MQLTISLTMSSLHILLALCVTLTTSLTLNPPGRHDLLSRVEAGVGSAYSAPFNMEIVASVDITPSRPSEPLSIGMDRTTSMVKPDVEIEFSIVSRDNLVPATDVSALEIGGISRETGAFTTTANTGSQIPPYAGSDASFSVTHDSSRWDGYYRQHLTSCVRRHKADLSRCIQQCKPTAPSYRSKSLQNPIFIQKMSQAWW